VFVPKKTSGGGSQVGNSYLSAYVNCPRKWFFSHLYPTEVDGDVHQGLRPRFTDPNLIKGSIVHEAMAAWYISGCRDGEDTGEQDLDRALVALDAEAAKRIGEYKDEEAAQTDQDSCRAMMVQYHDWYGPNGLKRDWPELSVVCDEKTGEPLVEQDYEMFLDYGNYWVTCRPDVVVKHHGFLKVMEHKTSSPYYVNNRLKTIHMDSQFTMELAVLTHLFPDQPLDGVLCNVLIKDRSLKSKFDVAVRNTTNRAKEQLAEFRRRVIGILFDIGDRVQQWTPWKGEPMAPESLDLWPAHGQHNGHCYAFNRECEFTHMCRYTQPHHISLKHFRPKGKEENDREA
jgi:hypothetical protein